MSVIIRPAAVADAHALSLLNREEMGYDYSPAATADKLELLLNDGKNGIFVAELDGQIVGYVHLNDYDLLYMPPMKNIMGIAVSKEHRRQGIGRLLLAAAERWAKETGAVGVRLVSGETRTGAHAFYRSLGYEGSKLQLNLSKMF